MELAPVTAAVRATDGPEVVVTEFDHHLHHRVTGQTFEAANIQVLRVHDGSTRRAYTTGVHDGLIVSSRGFHHHLARALAGGGAARLTTTNEHTTPARQPSRPTLRTRRRTLGRSPVPP
ncbi:hypothetical protein [Streptomyces sp. NBC_01264]|uniref:hypothetical protein n=1 Tax=Streptomyces sp. NBC_01264 TaxID=2903804 RepID=UPI00224CADF8|nr:hypothetical protein [Streptomyces sp. NBC_01264]MCX4776299.1 hypothetical protein [Streptomyces sp. NBC_01264]